MTERERCRVKSELKSEAESESGMESLGQLRLRTKDKLRRICNIFLSDIIYDK